jgi:CarD family transcriptional regulator
MENTGPFRIGEQIVHSYYGIGTITGIVEKKLGGETHRYYRAESLDAVYFVPLENADNSRVRQLVSLEKLEKMIKTLRARPVDMNEDYKMRRQRIKTVRATGNLLPMAQLLRDMYVRREIDKLTDAEKRSMDAIEERVLNEWAAVLELKPGQVRDEMRRMLTSALELAQEPAQDRMEVTVGD